MASGSEDVDVSDLQKQFEELKVRMEGDLRRLKDEVGDEVASLPSEPSWDEDQELDKMKKTKVQLESEIEATMSSPLLELPDDDPKLLTQLAKEDAEMMASNTAHALAVYRHKVKAMQEKDRTYEAMIDKATNVNDMLDRLLAEQTEKDHLEAMFRRFERSAVVFKALRTELHEILSDFYPEEGDSISMESLLDTLVTQLLENPNDPYIEIDGSMKLDHIQFLLRANLIVRHQQDITKIKFVDPRI